MRHRHLSQVNLRSSRRGAAAVEFALVAPLFITLVMGTIQAGIGISAAESITSALREGGRLATMDYSDHLLEDQAINQKVINDIKNFLTAERIDGSQVQITITHAEGDDAGSTFILSDPDNDLQLFKIKAVVPYTAICSITFFPHSAETISASLVYRKGKTSLVE